MKKKYWIEIIVFSTIIIVALIVGISIYNSNRDKTEEGLRSFKVETLEKDDGWYYTLEINKFKDESGNEKISSIFNGCNLKYETLDDNYITMTDDNGNIVGSIPMAPPSLNTSYRSKDNIKTEASEVQEINDLFSKLPFEINEIEVNKYDSSIISIQFKGTDSALLIGEKGYRYKAISYLLFNWINPKYGFNIRLEIEKFLSNQEEMIEAYLEPIIKEIKQSNNAFTTKPFDGVLAYIALKILRENLPDRFIMIKKNEHNETYIVVTNNNE